MMTATAHRRLGLGLVLALACAPAAVGAVRQQPEIKPEYFKGKVVPLAGLLEKQGVKVDADAAGHWLALAGDDGRVYPLVKEDSTRRFFMDKTLLNRPMRLTARLLTEPRMLQVIEVHSYVKGELHDTYYWCDVCSIRVFEPGLCACCGDPMYLKEVPAKQK